MAKKARWPRIRFRRKGPPRPTDYSLPFVIGRGFDYYDFLQRWNGGTPELDSFKVEKWEGAHTVARVRYFYGFSDKDRERDVRQAVYGSWDYLPRGALPIAEIDIKEDEWDLCMLLTFRWGENYNKIYLLANPHDSGSDNPDDLSELQFVSRSLPQFLRSLKSYDELCYRTWFQLPVDQDELRSLAGVLAENGFEDLCDFSKSDDSGGSEHDEPPFCLWLADPGARLCGVRAPKKVAKGVSVLAIDAFQWNQAAALKCVRAALKSLKLDRKLKKLGETPVG